MTAGAEIFTEAESAVVFAPYSVRTPLDVILCLFLWGQNVKTCQL